MTTYANNVTLAAAIDAKILPPFLGAAIMPRLVAPFALGANPNSRALDLPKSGTATAAVVAEAVAATANAIVDTKVTLTMQKAVSMTEPSAEALKYANSANFQRHAEAQAAALAQKFDLDCLALASGFSQSTTTVASLTVDKVLEAAYLVRAGNMPTDEVVAVLSHKQAWQLGSAVIAATGSFYSNPAFTFEGISGNEPTPGYRGKLFGIDIFASKNVPIDTVPAPDDFQGLVFAPRYAIAALYDEGVVPSFQTEISDQATFEKSTKLVKTTMWYQVAEYNDAAGVIVRSQI